MTVTKLALVTLGAGLLAGCGGSQTDEDSPTVQAERNADGTIVDDRTMCQWKGRADVEIAETAGPGSYQPNVRRVWKVFGTGADRRKVLVCREVDTNLDGIKDTVRFYSDEGQSKEERADTNFDGKIDTWNFFASGRLAEVRLDKNHDGKPDEWKSYYSGKLARVKRDSNYNGKADVWEMYSRGRLERMGVDVDGDERVDRWDHDSDWRREVEKADDKKRDDEAKKQQEDQERRQQEAEKGAAEVD